MQLSTIKRCRNVPLLSNTSLALNNLKVANTLTICNANVEKITIANNFEISSDSSLHSSSGLNELDITNKKTGASVVRVSGNNVSLAANSLVLENIPINATETTGDGFAKGSMYVDENGFLKLVLR